MYYEIITTSFACLPTEKVLNPSKGIRYTVDSKKITKGVKQKILTYIVNAMATTIMEIPQ